MKKALLILTIMAICFAGCRNRNAATGETDAAAGTDTQIADPDAVTWNGYTKIAPEDIDGNIIRRLGEEWMLITAGTKDSYNTMTASWGGLGIVWQTPVTWITVRNTRYTYEFLQSNDYYTLSFFDGAQKEAMTYLGTHSGRDGNKIGQTDLTPMQTELGCMSFEQATMIIECRKLFEDKLDPKSIFDDAIAQDYLGTGERHILFFGEIVNVWVKK